MNYYLQKLTRITTPGAHSIEAAFDDGYIARLDLLSWIQRGGIRAPLADTAIFSKVSVNEFGAPEWPGGIDLSPGTLRAWCEAGEVLTREQTDAWITSHSRPAQSVA